MENIKISDAVPCVVKYNDKFFCCYKIVEDRAHLIDEKGDKFSGTPTEDKLQFVTRLAVREFNKYTYFKTKIGVFSAATGKKVKMPEIIKMFQ